MPLNASAFRTISRQYIPMATKSKTTKIFISYAHEDQIYLERLLVQLATLKRKRLIEDWTDKAIKPGEQWDQAIKHALDQAGIVLFLVSPDFLASDYIHDVEISNALENLGINQTLLTPIIIRPCNFRSSELSKFQALPIGAKPISTYPDEDIAWLEVENGLLKLIDTNNTEALNQDVEPKNSALSNFHTTSNLSTTLDNINPQYIRSLIAQGETEKAIDCLINSVEIKNNETLQNSLVALSSRWYRLKSEISMGVVSSENKQLQNARITNALLSIVNDIKFD